MRTKTAFPILLLLLLISGLFAYPNNTVVVNYIKPAGSAPESLCIDPVSLARMFQQELSGTTKFNVINGAEIFNTEALQGMSRAAGYSEYDAILLGMETRTPLILLGRTRCLAGRVWIQIGLFDAEVEGKIREVSGYFDNSREDILRHAVPGLIRQLVDGVATPKKADPEPVKTIIVDNTKYLKWTLFGILAASAVYLIETLSSQKGDDTTGNQNTEIVAKW